MNIERRIQRLEARGVSVKGVPWPQSQMQMDENRDEPTVAWVVGRLFDALDLLEFYFTNGFIVQEQARDLLESLWHGPGITDRQRAQVEVMLDAFNRAQDGLRDDCPRGVHSWNNQQSPRRCLYCGATE